MTASVPGMGVVKTTPRKALEASIFAAGGWIRGSFVVPKLHALIQHLNTSQGFVKVTNVALPGVPDRVEFAALRADSFVFIIPAEEENAVLPAVREGTRHSVSCFFSFGYINGVLETLAGTRVSDFLQSNTRFFALRECTLRLTGQAPVNAPLILVNAQQILGISQPQIP